MAGLKSLCKKYFESDDLYAAMGVEKTANDKELKKAYYKLSLTVHPDRVEESNKEEATEKFKVLSKIYEILTDPKKRDLYDNSGIIEDDSEGSIDSWLDYWRAMFPPITEESIKEYETKYKGSQEEIEDIKKAYKRARGSIDFMHELVPFLTCEDEPRLIEIVKGLIAEGELEEYKIFTEEPASRRIRRHNKYKREAVLAKQIMKKRKQKQNMSDDDLFKQIQKRNEERTNNFLENLANKYSKLEQKSKKAKKTTVKRLSSTEKKSKE
ncbi:J domain-containing protein CG6693-like [Ctenocephalides felis]|uniref:J domain-containing protein CG6693-like n=1 Tax=Ctenocephalides felis TaxID=7515 RepID=UPI000E6E2294|nr:J domain-containing protein CG6693-like [Ctenocephalides felis]XP_026481850.1 J domain-containing protein CG6693-like [Ctenocephalides felis]